MTPQDRALIASFFPVLINTALSTALGALIGGLPGSQIGLVVGIGLSVLPRFWRVLGAMLNKRTGMIRFVAGEVAMVILRGAASVIERLETILLPLAALLGRPVLADGPIIRLAAARLGSGLDALEAACAALESRATAWRRRAVPRPANATISQHACGAGCGTNRLKA